jgi:putative membrane protein insertion efficiency factor
MKRLMRISTIILYLIMSGSILHAQNNADFDLILEKIDLENQKEKYNDLIKKNKNSADFLFSNMFIFYKSFISSQDGSNCTFHPSCSEYGLMSIQKYGVFEGVLKTSDRLLRCHGLSPEKYKFLPKENLLYDPL